ncbi:MAG: thiamine diphosphokinase [Candidatus Roizmanbacteria bacterium]|nr:thiamine diphosphokinase [Candidatus Roizmanbacteria bacterium]
MKRAIIFVNGNLSDLSWAKKIITNEDFLIAADGGVKHILKLGLIPDVVIGDFDSTSSSLQKRLIKICKEQKSLFPTIIKYPVKKDKTDFELAIDLVLERKYQEIIIFGILGNRIDHFLANIFLLTKIQTENKSIKIRIIEGNKEMYILNKEVVINGQIGDEISIIPINNKLEGITTDGLEYQLNNETLSFGSTKGISNNLNKTLVKITAAKGTALIVYNSY